MSYAEFKHECKALEGRDGIGRWIEFVRKSYYTKQESLGI